MSNKNKLVLVPKLRFQGFAQSWEQIPLGELGKFFRGLTYGADDVAKSGLLVLRSSNIQGGQLVLDSDLVFVNKQCPPELRLQRGDIAICMSNGSKALVGKSGEFDQDYRGELTVGAFCSIFRPATPFAKIAFSTPRYENFVAAGIAGGNINNLKNSDLESFKFHVPPSNGEQQKIADCLSSLDELIAAQARKVDALKTHKKGLMQQLFPREGETQPRLRFPEFQDAGDWMCEEISSCLEKVIDYRGKAPPKSESGVPLITARNVRFGWLDMTIDEYIEADEYEGWMTKGIPTAGDILFTTEAPLGNVALFPSAGKFALGQRIITLRANQRKCSSGFLFQSLLGPQMQHEVDFHSTGSTAKGIKSSVFVTIGFCYPGLEEQKRIADCLTSLDTLITAATQELEALKTHKKGLMQQLFPSAEVDA